MHPLRLTSFELCRAFILSGGENEIYPKVSNYVNRIPFKFRQKPRLSIEHSSFRLITRNFRFRSMCLCVCTFDLFSFHLHVFKWGLYRWCLSFDVTTFFSPVRLINDWYDWFESSVDLSEWVVYTIFIAAFIISYMQWSSSTLLNMVTSDANIALKWPHNRNQNERDRAWVSVCV